MADVTRSIKVGPTDRDPQAQMGAVISPEHLNRLKGLIEKARRKARA
jgi:acyl-CoA reductase-like NAD-dependent aldehyde dehydrogenase